MSFFRILENIASNPAIQTSVWRSKGRRHALAGKPPSRTPDLLLSSEYADAYHQGYQTGLLEKSLNR